MIYECFTVNLYLYFFFSICYVCFANLYNSLNDDYVNKRITLIKANCWQVSQKYPDQKMTREIKTLKGEPYGDDDDEDILRFILHPQEERGLMKD